MKKKPSKPVKMWAGFEGGGNLMVWTIDDGWGGFDACPKVRSPAIYPLKKAAMERFEDVRRVIIMEVKS